jgi:hypothetical protein
MQISYQFLVVDGVGFEPTNFVEDQIYSLAPLTTRPPVHYLRPASFDTKRYNKNSGAGGGSRTHDLLITNQLLYQLSYASEA